MNPDGASHDQHMQSVDEQLQNSQQAPTSPSVFQVALSARSELSRRRSQAPHLHLLNDSIQTLYAEQQSLSRNQFRSLISQIRQAASDFSASSPAFKPSYHSQHDAFAASNAIRRYASLLSETSKHTATLAHSIDAFNPDIQLQTPPNTTSHTRSNHPLPQGLKVGALSPNPTIESRLSLSEALAILDALCSALDGHARSLGLETFAEKLQDANTAPNAASLQNHTHTLTIGAKILVIDVELACSNQSSTLAPVVKLKFSYANDSAQPADGVASPTRDPQLAKVLEQDIIAVALTLFGQRRQAKMSEHVHLSDEEVAALHFNRLCSNLAELIKLDELAARSHESDLSPNADVFDAMQRLCSQVKQVSEVEEQAAKQAAGTAGGQASSSRQTLLERGHGIVSVHQSRPFLKVIYAFDETSETEYGMTLQVRPIEFSATDTPSSRHSSWPLSNQAKQLLEEFDVQDDPSTCLGSIQVGASQAPLHFVVHLNPPVVVSRSTASKLAAICGLPRSTGPTALSSSQHEGQADQAVWFEDVLSSSWTQRPAPRTTRAYRPRCAFTLVRSPDGLKDSRSQGLVIDSLPFLFSSPTSGTRAMDTSASKSTERPLSTASRIFAATELLRDEVRLTELLHSALSGDDAEQLKAEVAQRRILSSGQLREQAANEEATVPVSISLRFPAESDTAAQARTNVQALMMDLDLTLPIQDDQSYVDIKITIKPSSSTGWYTEATASLRGATKPRSTSVDPSEPEALAWSAILSNQTTQKSGQIRSLEAIDEMVGKVVEWSEKGLEVKIAPLGAANDQPKSSEGFDALAYEEKNVHEVYESIAPHFSSTRYKPWPLIPLFLSTVPAGSIGADLGCGNGKYLPIRSTLSLERGDEARGIASEGHDQRADHSLLTIGVDRSTNLLSLAKANLGMMEDSNKAIPKSSKSPKLKHKKNAINEPAVGQTFAAASQGTAAQEPTEAAEHPEAQPIRRLNEVAVGDAMMSGLRTGIFDYAISIATIHHFSTWERRMKAVQELIRVVKPVEPSSAAVAAPEKSGGGEDRLNGGHGGGRFMIFAWALEQKDEGKRQFEGIGNESPKSAMNKSTDSRQKDKERLVSLSSLTPAKSQSEKKQVTKDQDVLVPWVLTQPNKSKKSLADLKMTSSGGDIGRKMHDLKVDELADPAPPKTAPIYQRYYHVFHVGELEQLVDQAAEQMPAVHSRRAMRSGSGELGQKIKVIREVSGWERGNWWGIWRVEWA